MIVPTIYLTRNGLLEPLGQSQVLNYLRGLSADYRITVFSYEKAADWADEAAREALKAECAALGLDWRPRIFRAHPRGVASLLDLLSMFRDILGIACADKVGLIHARSYIPAVVAWGVSRLTGIPFIFDMRALWPEELITAGRLRRSSLLHRIICRAERVCLRDAAAVVSLTQAAVHYLRQQYPREMERQHTAVIPTCANLERFNLPIQHITVDAISVVPPVQGCIGTLLSGWFRLDWLAAWWAFVSEKSPQMRFEVLTRDDPAAVRSALDVDGKIGRRLNIRACHPSEMPRALDSHNLSVMFYAGGEISELGRCPTRMAEVLGSGQPVLANYGVGDVASIIETHRVGVLLEGTASHQLEKAWLKLLDLQKDADLPQRCRRVAEAIFSLSQGTSAYRALYKTLLH